MSAPTIAASALPTRAGAAPAGLNTAQLQTWARLEAARFAQAFLPPLDPDFLQMERRAGQFARLNGEDQ